MASSTQSTTSQLEAASSAQVPQSLTVLELVRHLLEQLSTLFRQELRLAAAQASQALAAMVSGATSIAVAGGFLFGGFLVLLSAAVLGLAFVLPAWLAAVLVGVAALLIGVLLLWVGMKRLSAVTGHYRRSAASLQEDKEVLTRHGRS